MEELMHPRAAAVPESDAARERLLNAHLLSATNQGSVTTYALRDIGLASAQPYHIRPLHQGFFRRSAPDQPCTANCSERYGVLTLPCTSGALSARGISIATAKTSVNAGRHRRTYRQEPGHKGGVGGALKEARHRRREDAPGGRRTCVPAELPGVVLSAFEHRLDRTARTYLSFIGAPESDRLP